MEIHDFRHIHYSFDVLNKIDFSISLTLTRERKIGDLDESQILQIRNVHICPQFIFHYVSPDSYVFTQLSTC